MNRRVFLAASATAAVASGVEPALAKGVPGGSHFVERKASFNEEAWAAAVGRPAKVRQLWDLSHFNSGIWDNIKNSLNGLQFGFGFAPDAIATAWCGHGPSAAYAYSDYVWKKYRIGEFFGIKNAGGEAIATNVFLAPKSAFDANANPDDPNGMYQDTSVTMLQRRGVIVHTCHTAVEEQSRSLIRRGLAPAGMSASAVADDILTHLIPGVHVVPSMDATIAVLQQLYRYTYATLA